MKKNKIILFSSLIVAVFAIIVLTVIYFTSSSKTNVLLSAAPDQSTVKSMLSTEWQDWKSHYVTQNGAGEFKRVQRDEATEYDTVSEGMGYGMLLAVYFDDQAVYDELFNYVKKYMNPNGLMAWSINASGDVSDWNCATDADQDIAASLCFAHKKWGSSGKINYRKEATDYINNLKKFCLDGSYVKPGDSWGGESILNPSYFSPAWYRVYKAHTGDKTWDSVIETCYKTLANIDEKNGTAGLFPDWCQGDGTKAEGHGYDFTYDAIRVPWRLAVDYSWYGDKNAQKYSKSVADFFSDKVKSMVDGYTITGEQTGKTRSTTFVAMIGASSMTTGNKDLAQSFYNEVLNTKDSYTGKYNYFGNSLRLLSLLYMTGNFQNLYE